MKRILALAVLLLFAFMLAAQEPPQPPQGPKPGATSISDSTTYINAGALQPVTSNGQTWVPDVGPPQLYNLGTPASCPTTSTTTGTNDPILYKTARVGDPVKPMVYTFNGLASGAYQVTLFFAECFWTAVGQRVFNVQINSVTAFTNVDIFAAVGKNVAYTLTAPANVATDTMTISFIPVTGKNIPIIDAIQLAHVHMATLNWTDTVNPAGSVAYNIYRSTGPCNTPSFAKIASLVPGFTYVDATIAPQTGYCYQITAQTTAVSSPPVESLPCNALYVPGSVSSCNCQ